jgi:hypothetical protein
MIKLQRMKAHAVHAWGHVPLPRLQKPAVHDVHAQIRMKQSALSSTRPEHPLQPTTTEYSAINKGYSAIWLANKLPHHHKLKLEEEQPLSVVQQQPNP